LARKDVIGLLPTGAGKSLCYQLSALLQPGITLVVDPIKSLMHDQDDHLKEAGIDTTTFVDSSLEGAEKTRRIKRFQDGQFQFTFVSPERLMIQEFRNALTKMGTGAPPKWFAYCVIDEAHCVSEWGHDFRTAYLRLGENARTFCKPASGNLPFIALTGTASFDVRDDVQRELQLDDEDAIVELGSYRREELHFEVITVQKPQGLPVNKEEDWKPAAKQKELYLANWLRKLPQQFGYQSGGNGDFYERNGERTNSGLIFCPHVNYVFGIHKVTTYLKENLPQIAESIGKYAGELDRVYLDKTQRGFRNNDLSLLVATKSFGMGIDKPNIRYTLHFNMPLSLEAFYQEAGRAGRDQRKAVCALLLSQEFSDKGLMKNFIKDAFQGEDKEKTVINDLLNKIEWPDTESLDTPGIEKILDTMTVSQTQQIIIPFENGRIKTISQYIHKDEKNIHDAYKWRYTVEKFARKLRVPVTAQLTTDFKHIRTESETFKAIYRMSVVGVIKDYTINYNPDFIEVIVRKQPDDEYVSILTKYVSGFMSTEDAKRIPKEIMQRRGNTVLQKCLGYLISFVYDRIKKQREEALDVMERAAKVGAYPNGNPEKSKAECQRDFSDFVYNYFDSCYTPELREKLYDYDLDLVWQYIGKVNGEPGPTKHLRGSCDRLLVENPDNAALLLLRAYARILLRYSEKDVVKDLGRGLDLLEKRLERPAVADVISRFYREVRKQDNTALPIIGSEMTKFHLAWLEKFNRRLKGG
jgi:ATP-dependent DNA helicase RecQ